MEDFEYTPKPEYEGPFIVFNEPDEVQYYTLYLLLCGTCIRVVTRVYMHHYHIDSVGYVVHVLCVVLPTC